MKTVLVVEDHRDTHELHCRMFRKMGYKTLSAYTGEEALALLAADTPDLISLDSMMPGMNGAEVLRLVRANANTALIPVIMITALSDEEFQENTVAKGANGFLVKSNFSFDELQAMTEKLLGG